MRLFVALDLPPMLRMRLVGLCGGIPGARWVQAENFHLTLRFIGEVAAWQAREIDDALAAVRAPGFTLALAGVGTFERAGKPHTLWVGVERNERLDHLRAKVETALQRAGLEPERRRFSPHVTLARLDEGVHAAKLAAFVQGHNLFRAGPLEIERFTLFSSRLGKEHAVYIPEVDYALA